MDETTLYEHILGITKPWFVEYVDLKNDVVHVYISYNDNVQLRCPVCGQITSRYDSKPRTWRHMDTCQYQTLIRCNIPRADCPEHGALQIDVPWAQKHGRFTKVFENQVIDWLQELSINAVARRFHLSWNAVDRIMREAVTRGLERRQNPNMTDLSVDEVSRKKGHNYVTIVSNKLGQVLSVQNGRDKTALNAFYAALSEEQLASIETISMDMSPAYIYATIEQIPNAKDKICFDKFHVIQDLNKAVDGVRKSELGHIATQHRRSLHLSRYVWMRNEDNLTEAHRMIKQKLSQVATKTARAWAILQYAKTLWDDQDPKSAEKGWLKWYGWAIRSRLTPMKTVAKAIKEKLWGIVNAITKKRTNAMAESINAKLKIIKVRAKGFTSPERYRAVIMFYLGGLNLKHWPT
jgi:transposase